MQSRSKIDSSRHLMKTIRILNVKWELQISHLHWIDRWTPMSWMYSSYFTFRKLVFYSKFKKIILASLYKKYHLLKIWFHYVSEPHQLHCYLGLGSKHLRELLFLSKCWIHNLYSTFQNLIVKLLVLRKHADHLRERLLFWGKQSEM